MWTSSSKCGRVKPFGCLAYPNQEKLEFTEEGVCSDSQLALLSDKYSQFTVIEEIPTFIMHAGNPL
jgi:hypothetical protein